MTGDSPIFDERGNVIRWQTLGRDWVETRPIRQNAPADFQGILIWTKSADAARADEHLLHAVEWDFETGLLLDEPERRDYERQGWNWTLRLSWTWGPGRLKLSAELASIPDGRWRQVEFSHWVPAENGGSVHSAEWSYEMPPYGRTQSAMLERGAPLSFTSRDGRHISLTTNSADSRSHFYHRGFCLKIGTGSPVAAPGGNAAFQVECAVRIETPPAPLPSPAEEGFPDLQARDYPLGLMLHLQYTALPDIPELLESWIRLAARLKFDYILLELDRGLKAHPATPGHALELERFRELTTVAKQHGIGLHPMYNLLGHQWETGVLDWQPSWRETAFSGLCPSHPEVRKFAGQLIRDLAKAFDSNWTHIGGDELKLPGDGREGLCCERCGDSPNLSAIVDYWNLLQREAPQGVTLAIWGDQLLPRDAIAPGLTAHNWDGRGREHLERLDRRIRIFDWQYGAVFPASSLGFLGQAGHSVFLTSAYATTLQNPFIHAEACRKGLASGSLHTTWASPDPRDLPLEGVAAAALAHAGHPYDPERTTEHCARLAHRMLRELSR